MFENTKLYPKFADITKKESFPEMAKTFLLISSVEKGHENRYRALLRNWRTERSSREMEGILEMPQPRIHPRGHRGTSECPACQHEQA